MAAPVKWGLVSTADINRKVIPGAHASEKVDLVGVATERLLADHVLAGFRRGDRRLRVQRVRAAVVEEADPLVRD